MTHIIRGATTIVKDEKEQISIAVKELLDEIFAVNSLDKKEVRGIVFSVTTDIHAFHPAKAARECGYDFAPLFACIEPEIIDGLKLCIRVMILIDTEEQRKIKHIYPFNHKIIVHLCDFVKGRRRVFFRNKFVNISPLQQFAFHDKVNWICL